MIKALSLTLEIQMELLWQLLFTSATKKNKVLKRSIMQRSGPVREIRKGMWASDIWDLLTGTTGEVANRLLPTTSYCLHHYHCRLSCYYLFPGFLKSSHWSPWLLLFTLCSTIVNQMIMLFNPLRDINHTENKTKILIWDHKVDMFCFLPTSQSTFPKHLLPYRSPCWCSNMPSTHLYHYFCQVFPLPRILAF